MLFLRKTVYLAWAVCAFSQSGFAQEVTATKTAPGLTGLLDKAYGKLETRYGVLWTYDKKDLASTTPRIEFQPILGTKYLDNKVFTEATFYGIKYNDRSDLERRATRIYTEAAAYKSKYYNLIADLDLYAPFEGKIEGQEKKSPFKGKLEVYNEGVTPEWSMGRFGRAKAFLGFNTTVAVNGEPETTTNVRDDLSNSTGFGAVTTPAPRVKKPDGSLSTEQKEPTFGTEYHSGIRYEAGFLQGLTAEAKSVVVRTFNPKYALIGSEDSPNMEKDGYSAIYENWNRIRVTYEATDRLTLRNDYVFKTKGVFEEGGDKRYENVVRVIYKVF